MGVIWKIRGAIDNILEEKGLLTIVSAQKLFYHTKFRFYTFLQIAQFLWIKVHNTDIDNCLRNARAITTNG